MTYIQRLDLTADFLEWTGGCSPETTAEIDVYLKTSMPFDYDKGAACAVLLRLMRRAAQAERRCAGDDSATHFTTIFMPGVPTLATHRSL